MSNASLIPVVESVVDEKVLAGELFTAHDITLEIRQRGHRAGHGEIRDAVHDYYARGGLGVAYSRTIISISGNGNPFLYHRGADDPSTYQNIRGNNIAVPNFSSIQNDDDDDDDDDVQAVAIPPSLLSGLSDVPDVPVNNQVIKSRIVDGRGTLSIPAPIIRQLGFKPRQKVYAVVVTDGVDVVATQPPADVLYRRYTVDDHQQVRLTQSLLQRAGIAGKQYDVEQLNNKVVVKLSK